MTTTESRVTEMPAEGMLALLGLLPFAWAVSHILKVSESVRVKIVPIDSFRFEVEAL